MKPSNPHRPEIDGLRAVAVVAVILFHLGVTACRGGFVGVDVFFVLSGYLITSLLRREIADGKFRYATFFVRRVRRLAPALLVMTSVTCVAAYFILLPDDLASFARSAAAQPVALQNMHFLAEGEYFRGSDRKALLHTWSLGVEEQFYLVWPFFMVFVSRLRRRAMYAWVIGVMTVSFLINLALPAISPKASFFLLPARTWELGAGGLLGIFEERWALVGKPSSRASGALAYGGAALLVFSFLWISEDMAFPGWVALVPVVGTAMVIASASIGPSALTTLLASRPFVAVGLISYSLYLWHWPLIALARCAGVDPTGLGPASIIAAASLGLAVLSHRFVEQPIRTRRVFSETRSMLWGVGALALVVLSVGVVGWQTDGCAFRFEEPARSMLTARFDAEDGERCGLVFRATHPFTPVCHYDDAPEAGERRVLLWGNSHAAMWGPLFRELGDEAGVPVYLNARNCRPLTDNAFCGSAVQSSVLAYAASHDVSDVVLANTWYGQYEIADDAFEASLRSLLDALSARNVRVWLVIDVPTDPVLDPQSRYRAHPSAPSFGAVMLEDHVARQLGRERSLFERLTADYDGVRIIDPTDDLCPDGVHCPGGDAGGAWYRDAEHVTNTGAARARARFAPIFE